MPELRTIINLDDLPVGELEELRRKLTLKARENGGPAGLPDEELRQWLECTRQLRRRHAGPSKKTKDKKTSMEDFL